MASCNVCGQKIYVTQLNYTEDEKTYWHWRCKETFEEKELRKKLHDAIDVMTIERMIKIGIL